jgi:hypothetical protein
MRIDMQTITDHADNITSYDLYYTIQGLPLPVTGVHKLPTAKDVVLLYCAPKTTIRTLTKAGPFSAWYVPPQYNASVTLDMSALWVTLPPWLQQTITTMLKVAGYMLPISGDGTDWEERESYMTMLISSMIIEESIPVVGQTLSPTSLMEMVPIVRTPAPFGMELTDHLQVVVIPAMYFSDQEYLTSTPGITDSIKDGHNIPFNQCSPEISWDTYSKHTAL